MKKNLKECMKILDIEQGGIFPEIKRSVVPGTSCLIISYGGTGSDALEVIKRNLEKHVDEDERKKYVRLLAIDTSSETKTRQVQVVDEDGQTSVQHVDRFTDQEFFWLNNGPAKQAIGLYATDNSLKQWINPELPKAIAANPTWLDGKGASSTRQLGRVLLYPQESVIALQTKITTLVSEITNNNNNTLKVFIITGISGGTGSGIVVDASYLIRHFITPMPGGVGQRTDYCGFLLLPPTGLSNNPVDINKGNRNGVAALKEIDHFMTIAFRGEEYSVNFAGQRIVSKENIFKTCYLIDGVHTGFAVSNPREKANEVVSDCILDMLTSQPIDAASGVTTQNVDSFLSDAATFAKEMVSSNSEHLAPRNANYVYCALGHGKTLIPLDLMKAYVAKTVFDNIYTLYRRAGNVRPDAAKAFIDEVRIKPFNTQNQIARVRQAVDARFNNPACGPYYTINLLRDVAQLAAELHRQAGQRGFTLFGQSKEELMAMYACIRNEALRLNNEIFNVYTLVLDEMKRYLDDQHGIICDSEKLQRYSGSTYTFTPIDFGGADQKAQKVKQYLDGLVDPGKVKALARDLIQEMTQNRAEWTQLSLPGNQNTPGANPKFDAGVRIRKFWEDKIGKIVSSTIEDYLLKYYANSPDARYEEYMTDQGPQPTENSVKYMTEAANAIVTQMWGGSGVATPLAQLQTGILPMHNFNGHNLFLVPKSAPHLRKFITKALGDNNIKNVEVRESFADDRLSCYSQYTGIPAFMFAWTLRAEPAYEAALQAANVGLHMSETKGGERWQDYPNLLVENIWDKLGNPPYFCQREHDIDASCTELFGRAQALGLTHKTALATLAAVGEYTMFTLPNEFCPNAETFKMIDTELAGTPARAQAEQKLAADVEAKAQQLFDMESWASVNTVPKDGLMTALEGKVAFLPKKMNFVNTVMTPLIDLAYPVVPAGWEEKLASELMRACPTYMFQVRGTVLVLERLFEKVSKAQRVKSRMQAFAHFLAADLFTYDPEYLQWTYVEGMREKTLLEMDFGVNEQKTAEYYFLFQKFLENADDITETLASDYEDKSTAEDKKERIQKLQALKTRAAEYAEQVAAALRPDKKNPDQTLILTTQAYRRAAENYGYDVDAIIAFYNQLLAALQLVPMPNFKP